MVEFKDAFQTISQNVDRLTNTLLAGRQLQQEQKQREFQRDLQASEFAFRIMDSKSSTDEQKVETFNKVIIPTAKKHFGAELEPMNPKMFGTDEFKRFQTRTSARLKRIKDGADPTSLFNEQISDYVLTAERFGRKQAIGEHVNKIATGALESQMKKSSETSDSPSKIQAQITNKFLAGQELTPEERQIFDPEKQLDPLTKASIQIVNNDLTNIGLSGEERFKKIQAAREGLQSISDNNRSVPDAIKTEAKDDMKKAVGFIKEGATIDQVMKKLDEKYKDYPRIRNALRNSLIKGLK